MSDYETIFDRNTLDKLFPAERSNDFFEALFGDASEGAYDIELNYAGATGQSSLRFELHLKQRPGQCLACNLTYGLPEVFSRHPVINIAGVVKGISELTDHPQDKMEWKLGSTQSPSSEVHIIPLTVDLL